MRQAPTIGNKPFEAVVSHLESSLWNMNEFDRADQEMPLYDNAPPDSNPTDPLNTVFSEFDNVDWGLIDQSLIDLNGDGDVTFDWEMPDEPGGPPLI